MNQLFSSYSRQVFSNFPNIIQVVECQGTCLIDMWVHWQCGIKPHSQVPNRWRRCYFATSVLLIPISVIDPNALSTTWPTFVLTPHFCATSLARSCCFPTIVYCSKPVTWHKETQSQVNTLARIYWVWLDVKTWSVLFNQEHLVYQTVHLSLAFPQNWKFLAKSRDLDLA